MSKDEAILLFGTASNLARALGITRQAVGLWGEMVPPLRAYQIREIIADRKGDTT